jgi:hypothetical protein
MQVKRAKQEKATKLTGAGAGSLARLLCHFGNGLIISTKQMIDHPLYLLR